MAKASCANLGIARLRRATGGYQLRDVADFYAGAIYRPSLQASAAQGCYEGLSRAKSTATIQNGRPGRAPSYMTSAEARECESAWAVCVGGTLRSNARDLGVEIDRLDMFGAVDAVAREASTSMWPGWAQAPAYTGCYDGLWYRIDHP